MRYHLESTLPIHAFSPRGGRGPFSYGMTLEGGGGGGIVSAITDPISSVLGTDGGGGGILGGIEDVGQAVGGALADVDKFVGNEIPGGWGTVAAIAVPYLAPELIALQAGTAAVPLTAGQAAAVAAGTSAATGAIQGKDPEDILKNAALAGVTSYGLNSLGGAGESIDLDAPYVDMPDGEYLLTPDSISLEEAIKTSYPSIDPNIPIEEFGPTNFELGRVEMSDVDPTRMEGIRSLVAESGVDPMSATGGRFDPFIGVNPTSNIYTDLPVGYEFMGPNGMEIVGPNGKTYLQKDLYNSLADLSNQPSIMDNSSFDGFSQNVFDPKKVDLSQASAAPIFDYSTPASAETQKMVETGYLDRLSELPGAGYDMAKSYVTNYPLTSIGTVLGIAGLAGEGPLAGIGQKLGTDKFLGNPSPRSGSQSQQAPQNSKYTGGYGPSGGVADPYLLRERINASNIYNYRNPYTSRYAEGGEVKHFALGGISNAFTRLTQPIEKAIVQPVGQALPFLKDVAPYAGILAAPFIANPAMAIGVGSLSSGFGRPGSGFDMKRALMGGIAAYGAYTLGAGVEAAGAEPVATSTSNLISAPPGTVGEGVVNQTSALVKEAPKGFFRDTDAMQKGVGNLLSSDSDAATKAFSTKAGTFKSGVPLVMGTSGMMAIDEANKMREEAEIAAGPARQEQADMLARISKGKKRAEEAVRANPYMYAMGGQIDDELGGDYSAMGMDQGNLQKGLFGMGYKEGGNVSKKSTRLEDNLPELNDNFKETDFEKRLEPSIFRLTGAPNSLIDNPYVKGITGRVGGSYVVDRDTQLTAGLGGFAGRNPSGYTIKPESADVGIVRKMGPGYLAAQYQRNLMGNRAGDRIMANYAIPFAEGGTPRFLSGGGDGMSDSIPATIEGKQEARLADGEFVIPADVVSHLGNGSSKAGAKQLYSMMDRVRKARTGNEKQGRQIKPNKMMPA